MFFYYLGKMMGRAWGWRLCLILICCGVASGAQAVTQNLSCETQLQKAHVAWLIKGDRVVVPAETRFMYIGFWGMHTYLSFQGTRIDGDLFEKFRKRHLKHNILDYRGVILQFELNPQMADQIRQAIDHTNRAFTCSGAICRVLHRAGAQMETTELRKLLPWHLREDLIESGIVIDNQLVMPKVFGF